MKFVKFVVFFMVTFIGNRFEVFSLKVQGLSFDSDLGSGLGLRLVLFLRFRAFGREFSEFEFGY